MQIKVTYNDNGTINKELDLKLRKALESVGSKWYAQGMETQTGERDICFDWKEE